MNAKSFLSQSTVVLAVHVSGYALQLLMHGSLPLVMDVTSYGQFVLCLAWSLLLTKFTALGLESTLVRFVAIYRRRSRPDLVRHLIRWSRHRSLLASLAALLACILGSLGNTLLTGKSNATLFALTGLCTLLSTQLNLQAAALRGVNQVVRSQLGVNCVRPVLMLALVLATHLVADHSPTAAEILTLYCLGTGLTFVAMKLISHNWNSESTRVGHPAFRFHARLWYASAHPLLLSSIATLILQQSGILTLGVLTNAHEVARMSLAMRIASLCVMVSPVIDAITGNRLATLYYSRRIDELQDLVTISSRFSLLAIGLTFSAIVCAGDSLLAVFGREYHDAHSLAILLSAGWLGTALCGKVGLLLSMTGRERSQLQVVAWAAGGSLLLSIILVPPFGAMGATLSCSLCSFLCSFYLARIAKRELRVTLSPFHFRKRPAIDLAAPSSGDRQRNAA